MMQILNETSLNETKYRQIELILARGGMVVYPTETCYGIGVDATNIAAVQKLIDYKGGRGNKPISVAVTDMNMAKNYVDLNETAKQLYETMLPGPLTVVSKDKGKVVKKLVSDMGSLGIRIPDYPMALELIRYFRKPITATSANTSGKKPPYSLDEWRRYTSPKKQAMVDVFVDAGKLPLRLPSTLVDTTLNEPTILRQGEVQIPASAYRFVSSSVVETIKTGGDIMSSYIRLLTDKPVIIALQGSLGAGKTQLVKGIAKRLGVKETVKSPTYMIVKEYALFKNKRLYHIDTWRLHEGEELAELGLLQMLTPGNVVAIEWLEKVGSLIASLKDKVQIVWVDIDGMGDEPRTIRWTEKLV